MTSFFNVVDYKFKNFMIGAFYDWEPYNKKLIWSLTFKFKNLESTFPRSSKSSSFCGKQRWQRKRKCLVVSTSLPHAHIAFIVSPKTMSKFMFI